LLHAERYISAAATTIADGAPIARERFFNTLTV
jgi:hypothetical protein